MILKIKTWEEKSRCRLLKPPKSCRRTMEEECERLRELLNKMIFDYSYLEDNLRKAQLLVDKEMSKTRKAQRERDKLAEQIWRLKEFLKNEGVPNQLCEEACLPSTSKLSPAEESDRSVLKAGKSWTSYRPSSGGTIDSKNLTSSRNTTAELGATDPGQTTASVELTINVSPVELRHCLQQKTVIIPHTCGQCAGRIRFGKAAMKCKQCKMVCHLECKDNLVLPCIPVRNMPAKPTTTDPMANFDIFEVVDKQFPDSFNTDCIYCINETETEGRGLSEI